MVIEILMDQEKEGQPGKELKSISIQETIFPFKLVFHKQNVCIGGLTFFQGLYAS